jgi:hypothetical protein
MELVSGKRDLNSDASAASLPIVEDPCRSFLVDRLYDAGFFQSAVGAVFGDGLEGAGSELHGDKLIQFRYPDAARLEIREKSPGNVLGHVPSDAALFLGQAAAMDHVAFCGFRARNTANS